MPALSTLRRITENPYLNIFVSLLLFYSGISETVHNWEGLKDFQMGVHHGVILFAILNVLKNLPDLFEGLKYIEELEEKKSP